MLLLHFYRSRGFYYFTQYIDILWKRLAFCTALNHTTAWCSKWYNRPSLNQPPLDLHYHTPTTTPWEPPPPLSMTYRRNTVSRYRMRIGVENLSFQAKHLFVCAPRCRCQCVFRRMEWEWFWYLELLLTCLLGGSSSHCLESMGAHQDHCLSLR